MIKELLDVNAVFFTFLNYPMSYVEFFGTIFTGWSVYLSAKNKIISWPIGIVGVVLYMFLFFQIRLYSDFFEQIYYLITGFWGWWLWAHPGKVQDEDRDKELKIGYYSKNTNTLSILGMILMSMVVGYFMSKIHLIWPVIFGQAASYPYWDGLTTVISFVANFYLMKRKIENWYLWIIVDVIGVILYYSKGVIFLSLLYFLFLLNAFRGYFEWKKIYKNYVSKI